MISFSCKQNDTHNFLHSKSLHIFVYLTSDYLLVSTYHTCTICPKNIDFIVRYKGFAKLFFPIWKWPKTLNWFYWQGNLQFWWCGLWTKNQYIWDQSKHWTRLNEKILQWILEVWKYNVKKSMYSKKNWNEMKPTYKYNTAASQYYNCRIYIDLYMQYSNKFLAW